MHCVYLWFIGGSARHQAYAHKIWMSTTIAHLFPSTSFCFIPLQALIGLMKRSWDLRYQLYWSSTRDWGQILGYHTLPTQWSIGSLEGLICCSVWLFVCWQPLRLNILYFCEFVCLCVGYWVCTCVLVLVSVCSIVRGSVHLLSIWCDILTNLPPNTVCFAHWDARGAADGLWYEMGLMHLWM